MFKPFVLKGNISVILVKGTRIRRSINTQNVNLYLSSLPASFCHNTGTSSTAAWHCPSPHSGTQIWKNLQNQNAITRISRFRICHKIVLACNSEKPADASWVKIALIRSFPNIGSLSVLSASSIECHGAVSSKDVTYFRKYLNYFSTKL